MGGGASEVRMGDFRGVAEERNTRGTCWATRERWGAKGEHPAVRSRAALTNARVRTLKVIKPRLPS